MKKAKIGLQKSVKKKGRGRPAIGQNYTVRLTDEMIAEIDAYATDSEMTRSDAHRKLLQLGLLEVKWRNKRRPREPKPAKSE